MRRDKSIKKRSTLSEKIRLNRKYYPRDVTNKHETRNKFLANEGEMVEGQASRGKKSRDNLTTNEEEKAPNVYFDSSISPPFRNSRSNKGN